MTPASPPPPALPRRSTSLLEAPKESVITRLLIAPLTFVSFLLTLALIDHRNSSLRAHGRAPSRPPAADTFSGRVRDGVHGWIYRPQPYAYVQSPAAMQRETGGDDRIHEGQMKQEPWHWQTKQRKMITAEVEDALEMRKRVVVAMMAALAALAAGLALLVSWLWRVMAEPLIRGTRWGS